MEREKLGPDDIVLTPGSSNNNKWVYSLSVLWVIIKLPFLGGDEVGFKPV